MKLKRHQLANRRQRRHASRVAARQQQRSTRIEASGLPALMRFASSDETDSSSGSEFTLIAADSADAGDGKPKLQKFKMTAYTGGHLDLAGYAFPVVVDLAGMQVSKKSKPILHAHDHSQIVGHTSEVTINNGSIGLTGVISGTGSAAKEVAANAANGFPYEASIGAKATKLVKVDEGETVTVNGRSFKGPIYVARQSQLKEVSFVAIGADRGGASATLVAQSLSQGRDMNFAQWLKANGFDEESKLSPKQLATLKAAFQADIAADAATATAVDDDLEAADDDEAEDVDPAAQRRTAQRTARRVQASDDQRTNIFEREARALEASDRIRSIAAAYDVTEIPVNASGEFDPTSETRVPFASHALRAFGANRWSLDRIELIASRAGRPQTTPQHNRGSAPRNVTQIITAALCLSLGVPADMQVRASNGQTREMQILAAGMPKADREQVLNAAMDSDYQNFSLHALMDEVILSATGNAYRGNRKSDSFIRAAIAAERIAIQASGFSTISLSGILSNVANKLMLARYQQAETTWQQIAATGSNSDFKAVTRYRLDSTGAFKKVAPDGEIKHVGFEEASYTSQLETYGAMLSLNRQMMINDDLNAFAQIPAAIGDMAAIRVEEGLYALILSNPSSFFSTGHKNLTSGGSSALSVTSLNTLKQKFRDQVSSNGKPILVAPAILLVPTTLETTAQQLYTDETLASQTATSTSQTDRNPHKGLFRPVVTPFLNNTAILDQDGNALSGQSDTQWYLLADPARLAAFRVSFLNGQQVPTIQSADTEFSTLGMQWRGFLDFDVGVENYQAVQKSAGA